jgi:hypothetical protein
MAFIHENLINVVDQCMREITSRYAGIDLLVHNGSLSNDICTVHTVLEGQHRTVLLLCADIALMAKFAQNIMHTESVTQQDIEDVATEYFNVICGRIVAGLSKAANISSRFQVPRFRLGCYVPEEPTECCRVLYYSGGDNQNAQLTFANLVPSDSYPDLKIG